MIKKKKFLYFFISIVFIIELYLVLDNNKNKYFFQSNYFIKFPVFFTSDNQPCIYIEIEGKKYLLIVDLGSKRHLALKGNILDDLQKERKGTVNWKDVNDNQYEMPSYTLPKIEIGGLVFNDITVNEESYDYFSVGSNVNQNIDDISKNNELKQWNKIDGIIGRPLLEKINLLFDLGHSVIFATDLLDEIKKYYFKNDFNKIPLERLKDGSIIFKVDTVLGVLNFTLDSAATNSPVKEEKVKNVIFHSNRDLMIYFTSSKFVIGGVNYGPMDLYPYPLTSLLPEDGLLGVDFLSNHIIYLDFKNNFAYIKKNKCDCGRKRYFDVLYSDE